ncbi:hypothetical protein D3C78_961480 [compost metagenome]
MVVDDALGVAGGAGGVVEADRLPLVARSLPGEFRVALGQQGLVVEVADPVAFAVLRVVDLDQQDRPAEHADGGVDHLVEFAVGDQRLGLAVLQHEGDGLGVQAHVEGVEHRADHRHAEVRLEHGRDVRQHHRHRIALADAAAGQRRGQAPAALVGFAPGAADRAVDHGRALRVDAGGALEETERGEGNVVDRGGREALLIDRHERSIRWLIISSVFGFDHRSGAAVSTTSGTTVLWCLDSSIPMRNGNVYGFLTIDI